MSKRKILVFTGTRADYGIMYWLMKELQEHKEVDMQLLVSGTHLSEQHGNTCMEIEKDGFEITRKVEILPSDGTPDCIAKTVAIAISGYTEVIVECAPDIVLILGDRYEALAMAQTAFLTKIPIVHLHGGEITEGANDDRMRHAISKFSDLHFASSELHRNRLLQLGENPHAVMVSGAPGLEHIERSNLPSLDRLSDLFDFDFRQPYFLIAYHPVTNLRDSGIKELKTMLDACSRFDGFNFVLSLTNADRGANAVCHEIMEFCDEHAKKVLVSKSYGHLNFLSIIRYATLMIGNSSSGIIEAPSLRTPTIDIGSRQMGRERAGSVISGCGGLKNIEKTIHYVTEKAYSDDDFSNPYYKKNSSALIVANMLGAKFCLGKKFHDTSLVHNLSKVNS